MSTRSNLVRRSRCWTGRSLHPGDARPAAGRSGRRSAPCRRRRPAQRHRPASPVRTHSDLIQPTSPRSVTRRWTFAGAFGRARRRGDRGSSSPSRSPATRSFCGALDRFSPAYDASSGYDAVVALDGLDRLVASPPGHGRSWAWADALGALQEQARSPTGQPAPRGRRTRSASSGCIQAAVAAALPTRRGLRRRMPHEGTHPPASSRSRTALRGKAGLERRRTTYAVFPSLVDAEVALTDVSGPLPAALAARAMADVCRSHPHGSLSPRAGHGQA